MTLEWSFDEGNIIKQLSVDTKHDIRRVSGNAGGMGKFQGLGQIIGLRELGPPHTNLLRLTTKHSVCDSLTVCNPPTLVRTCYYLYYLDIYDFV